MKIEEGTPKRFWARHKTQVDWPRVFLDTNLAV